MERFDGARTLRRKMPELPEVETIRLHLLPLIRGKRIVSIDVFEKKQFVGNSNWIVNSKIIDVQRYGKMIKVILSAGHTLFVHLKMSGQLLFFEKKPKQIPIHARIVITFSDHSVLIFNDTRKFGWFKVIDNSELLINNLLNKLGPEPFDEKFTDGYLRKIFSKSTKPIKIYLLDQTKIAGLGNIYANEALFKAGIKPTREAKSLTIKEITLLRKAIIEVLKAGIFHGGSSAKDGKYIRPDGSSGKYQHHFLVYQKEKKPCLQSCGSTIERINLGGRGTFYCPLCQH
jgi:formamidopyrimidine-DNA glycosylase